MYASRSEFTGHSLPCAIFIFVMPHDLNAFLLKHGFHEIEPVPDNGNSGKYHARTYIEPPERELGIDIAPYLTNLPPHIPDNIFRVHRIPVRTLDFHNRYKITRFLDQDVDPSLSPIDAPDGSLRVRNAIDRFREPFPLNEPVKLFPVTQNRWFATAHIVYRSGAGSDCIALHTTKCGIPVGNCRYIDYSQCKYINYYRCVNFKIVHFLCRNANRVKGVLAE